jgi:large subunit ribosomal protein L5
MERLKQVYADRVVPRLKEQFGYRNIMEVPRLEKAVLNIGCGEAVGNPKVIEAAVADLTAIAGQKPVVRRARKSISNFKLRGGMPIGVSVTLRRDRMWELLERFLHAAVPRIRDFRGLSPKGFDGRGNYTVGIREQIIFPEIDYDKIDKIRGMNLTLVTTAKTDPEALALLSELGLPFRK